MLDAKEILNYLPHRYPFLLVDRIVEIQGDEKIVGIKNVSFNEPFFQGHFPDHPVMPGVLICEAMAQVGAIFAHTTRGGMNDRANFHANRPRSGEVQAPGRARRSIAHGIDLSKAPRRLLEDARRGHG